MYYIAVYDTGKGNPSQTIHLLNTIMHELEFEYIIDSYTSDQELIQAIRTNPASYDVVFLRSHRKIMIPWMFAGS